MVNSSGDLFMRFNDSTNLLDELLEINYFIKGRTFDGCGKLATVENTLKNRDSKLYLMYQFVSERKGRRFDLARERMFNGLEFSRGYVKRV